MKLKYVLFLFISKICRFASWFKVFNGAHYLANKIGLQDGNQA